MGRILVWTRWENRAMLAVALLLPLLGGEAACVRIHVYRVRMIVGLVVRGYFGRVYACWDTIG